VFTLNFHCLRIAISYQISWRILPQSPSRVLVEPTSRVGPPHYLATRILMNISNGQVEIFSRGVRHPRTGYVERSSATETQTRLSSSVVAVLVHAAVAQQLLAARCNIDLQTKGGNCAASCSARGAHRNRHADTEHKAKRCSVGR